MARNTRKMLADSLKVQLTRKPLEKITISDITNGCDMNRMTFYYHFRDIYDLLDWMFRDIAERVLRRGSDMDSWESALEEMFRLTLENKDFILHIYRSLGWGRAERYLYDLISPLVRVQVMKYASRADVSEENAEFVVTFLSYGITGNVVEWINNGMSDEYETICGKLITILNGMPEAAIFKFVS